MGLIAWLFASYSFVRVLDVLAHAGAWGFAAIVAFHLTQMLFSALGWEVIATSVVADSPASLSSPPRLKDYLLLRWIREAANNLLPLAQIGGEIVVARLLQRRGVRLAEAIGGTIADLLLEMSTQVLFTVIGVALLATSPAAAMFRTLRPARCGWPLRLLPALSLRCGSGGRRSLNGLCCAWAGRLRGRRAPRLAVCTRHWPVASARCRGWRWPRSGI